MKREDAPLSLNRRIYRYSTAWARFKRWLDRKPPIDPVAWLSTSCNITMHCESMCNPIVNIRIEPLDPLYSDPKADPMEWLNIEPWTLPAGFKPLDAACWAFMLKHREYMPEA